MAPARYDPVMAEETEAGCFQSILQKSHHLMNHPMSRHLMNHPMTHRPTILAADC